jgi:hypothetical protein
MSKFAGGCLCGAVRYECAVEPLFSGNCHCPTCGGRVFGRTSGFPQFILITADSLDDPSRFKPAMEFFTSSAQLWGHMNPELPKFPKQPRQ